MTLEQLRQIGNIQLEIMDEIHRVCVKHNIRYYIIAGTLLGAVRHKGFIPWDLDMDIAMPREDYERFQQLSQTALAENYAYIDHETYPNYMRPHGLVIRKDTRIHLKYDHLNPKIHDLGVYVDIFPLDNAPDDVKLRQKQAKKLWQVRRFKERRIPYGYSYCRWRRWVHYGVSALLSWMPVQKLNRYQQALMQTYRQQETKCLCSMASQYAYEKQCMPREVYGAPVLLTFEGRQYYAPQMYEEYLTRLYGDYMQLPPPEKQQANLEVYTGMEIL